jgi:predicted GNAT family N-acyltransferase
MEFRVYETLVQEAIAIRQEVFQQEQHFVEEFDALDHDHSRQIRHMVAYEQGNPVACCRYYADDTPGAYLVGRIAVRKPYRGQQIGAQLLREVEARLSAQGAMLLSLSAQVAARAFYEKQGYTASGEIYYDEHCPHIHMEKVLCPHSRDCAPIS